MEREKPFLIKTIKQKLEDVGVTDAQFTLYWYLSRGFKIIDTNVVRDRDDYYIFYTIKGATGFDPKAGFRDKWLVEGAT